MNGALKTSRSGAQIGMRWAVKLSGRVGLWGGAMLHEGFHRESAGDFAVRFATHAIGEHKKVQWRNDAETIFVVCAHATYVAQAATHDSHTSSHCCRQSTPCLLRYQEILFPR